MQVPSPNTLRSTLPLSKQNESAIASHRSSVTGLITGKDPRLAIIVGPCSLHDPVSALEYANRLVTLQKQMEKTCLLVMRAHIEKPRTCLGWKGFLYDPLLTGKEDVIKGLYMSRKLLLDLVDTGIPLASEFLDPLTSGYFSDLISWGFIGARTSTSQVHRQLASSLPVPVGFKNFTDGNIENVVLAAVAACHSHTFLEINSLGMLSLTESSGNRASHIVLRGSDKSTNYDSKSILEAIEISEKFGLANRILIDCSHGNSQKKHTNQETVLYSILEQYIKGNRNILGMMLESHLEEGSQSVSESVSPSVSITDPCLDWSSTEELLSFVNDELSSTGCSSSRMTISLVNN